MTSFLQALRDYLSTNWRDLVWPAMLFAGVLLLGLVIRRIVFGRLKTLAKKTGSPVDDAVVDSLRGPVLLWIVILGIYAATDFSRLPPTITRWSERILVALWIVSLTLVLSRLAGRLMRLYAARTGTHAMGTLPQTLATVLVALVGIVTLLSQLGVEIRPLLTALGVGGLAVALALQDTLSNLFAGFYVSLARQIRVGDFIQMEGGQRGTVQDVGWRTTVLREPAGNLIVIPNNKVAQSIIVNFSLPQPQMVLAINIRTSYANDADQVERILQEEAKAALGQVPGLLENPAPNVLFVPGFGDNFLEFTLICHVTSHEAQGPVQHELRKRVFRRFRAEGIAVSALAPPLAVLPKPRN